LLILSGIQRTHSQTKIIKPKNIVSKVSIIVSGKSRTYYLLTNDNATVLSVKGPGKLKIITRGQFNSSNNEYWNYSVIYRIDGTKKIKVVFNKVRRDANAEFKGVSLGIPAAGENIYIDFARGEHTIELWSESANPKIHARFIFTEGKEKKINWIPLSPLFPNEPVSLVTNEDVVSYYRFSSKKPLKIRITGPTTLKILNRLEASYKMKGIINYRIQVKEDKVLKNTYMLNCIGSDVTSYKKPCGKIPGKANEIVINVPGGTHLYEMIPLDKDKNTVLARILFPKQDVKLEE
jgi:hypothetical protein